MSVIYKPKGRAAEYCPDGYALNIYKGCTHGCTYPCYNSRNPYTGKNFFESANPKENIIFLVEKEAPKYRGEKVFLSFLSDPFQPAEQELKLTHKVLEIFLENGIIPIILTKGSIEFETFMLLMKFKDLHFGITLTLHDNKSMKYEPGAILPSERLVYLREAGRFNKTTWVSLEPVISPDEALKFIKETHGFVDYYRIGKWNYNKRAGKIDWKKFTIDVVELCEKLSVTYYLKSELQKYVKTP